LRWLVGLTALVALVVTLFFWWQPDPNSTEAKVHRILEPLRRGERNQKGFFNWVQRWQGWPAPFPRISRWIRGEDPQRSYIDVNEELLLLGDEAGPTVLHLLEKDGSPAVRRMLCSPVINFGGIDPLPVLTNLMLQDPDMGVRSSAAEMAAKYDSRRAAPALLVALNSNTNAFLQSTFIRALTNLEPKIALGPLLKFLQDTNGQGDVLQVSAAQALGALGDPAAVPALRVALESHDDDLSGAAALSLAALHDRESVPRIVARLEKQVDAILTPPRPEEYPVARPYSTIDNSYIESLGELADPSAISILVKVLPTDRSFSLGTPAVEALGKIGDERALKPLLNYFSAASNHGDEASVITAIARLPGSNTVPALVGILTNHAEHTSDVIEALATIRGEPAMSQWRGLLRNATGRAREAAALALGLSGDAEALPVLMTAIDSTDDEERKAAAQALGMVADARAVPALVKAMKSSSEEVRRETAWSLGYVGDPRGVSSLLAGLSDEDFGVRFAAAIALAGIQSRTAVPKLEALLNDKERRVRIAAAFSLCFHDSEAGLDQLKNSLRSRSEDWHRFAAIVGLLRLHNPAALAALQQAPIDAQTPLKRLLEDGLKEGPAQALTVLLRSDNRDYRHYAARVLPFFHDPATLPALRRATNDPSSEVRSAARVAVVQIRRTAKGSVPTIDK
jgi:HEAT repeat protein